MNTLQKNCLVCSSTFIKPISESLNNWGNRRKYCSKECADKAPRSTETKEKMRKQKVGKPSWNKGKKLTEAHKKALRKKHKPLSQYTKEKMSKTRTGRKLTLQWRLNISKGQKGEKGSNWQGGKTAIHETLRHSVEYKIWREAVLEKFNWHCTWCGVKRGWNKILKKRIVIHADHIKPFSIYPELRFELSNGRALCIDCHKKTDTYGVNLTKLSNKIAKNTNAA